VEKYCTARQATDDSMAHGHCMLDIKGYKPTLRICNTYCFSTATMVTRTRINITRYAHWLSFWNSIFQCHFLDVKMRRLFEICVAACFSQAARGFGNQTRRNRYPPPCGCFSLRTTAARTGTLREWDPGATPAPATAAGEVAPSWKSRPTRKTPTWWVQHRIQDTASTAWNWILGLPNYFMDNINSKIIIVQILYTCWPTCFIVSCKESACGQEQS